MRALWASLALLATLASPARADLRVLTFNAWDLPVVSRDRTGRLARTGPAVAALAPDLVGFQEVWPDADARLLADELARAGLRHAYRPERGRIGSGLLVVSRFPLERPRFHAFTVAGDPFRPWHGDFYATKGVAVAHVATPGGRVAFAVTHLHATYASSDPTGYLAVRTAQAIELADVLAAEEAPLVLAGDVNAGEGTLPFRLLGERAGLEGKGLGIDWVLGRGGARVASAERVLEGLSDHVGVLATVTVGPPSPRSRGVVRDEAEAALRAELDASRARGRVAKLLLATLAAATASLLVRRRRRRARTVAVACAAVGAALVAARAFLYEPSLVAGLTAGITAVCSR